jgi:hypothetical protein
MIQHGNFRQAAGRVLKTDDVEQILSDCFFTEREFESNEPATREQKPEHYKIICISLYNEDLVRLDEMVSKLKKRGLTKASRSGLIRFALSNVDLDLVPRGL